LLDGYCAIWRGDPLARRAKLNNALVTANVSRLETLRPPLVSRGGFGTVRYRRNRGKGAGLIIVGDKCDVPCTMVGSISPME
jgi:hypothetical protein